MIVGKVDPWRYRLKLSRHTSLDALPGEKPCSGRVAPKLGQNRFNWSATALERDDDYLPSFYAGASDFDGALGLGTSNAITVRVISRLGSLG
jgi:hypothetical protein